MHGQQNDKYTEMHGQQNVKKCRVLFQKQIWEISASRLFYYKNISRCTVTWMSSKENISVRK
jgi:hypothetical protein